ncbi:PREDICTED: protocadherin alpha-1-like [Ceratotherium simum simum]|uniref:Protocadherin alpha-1-like n=1 Tax=Ceratotherium simum simum TaxID=73337 RepID=A0ABM1DCH8_CERSS|nr:PREDICTED: protocadherin alpha-1-like [Ceratotherium simum simum]
MLFSRRGGKGARRLLLSLLLLAAWKAGSGQVHYSVSEEAKHGTFVGRIAQDLGLELAELVPRLFRVASKGRGDLLEVNLQNGILFVNSRIDREELCGRSLECSIHLEVIVERPLQVFHVEVEVKDVNDNPPVFREREQRFFIPESRLLDSRFPIEGAADADIGTNALLTYTLSPSDYFSLDVQASDELSKSLSLELRKSLDREETPELHLLLTATDGGKPELEGTVQLLITVLDVNDNAPLFSQALYRVHLSETTAKGTLVTILNASDADEGVNGEIVFSFGTDVPLNVQKNFKIDSSSGEIRLIGRLDYEETKSYEIQVKAVDKGSPPMSNHCKVLVKVLDVNDNAPELAVTSLSLPVREDAPLSTVVAFMSVSDRDSGANGQVTCTLTPHVPFKLMSTFKNYYSLVLDSALDRESTANYEVVVTARDGGSPSLSATASVSVEVADVNDNAPAFAQPEYTVFVKENNPPGCHIFTVSARDADAQENARVSYSLVERRVRAVDADSGYNAWLSYELQPAAGGVRSPFRVGLYTGEISTTRALDEADLPRQRLLVLVKDHGEPALTATATVLLSLVESGQALKTSSRSPGGAASAETALVDVNVYLIVAICAVSSLLVLTLLLYTALRCSAPPTEGACGPGKPTLVCSSAVESWSYSQQRRQRVCSGEGPPKTDLMAFSPSLPPGLNTSEENEHPETNSDLSGNVSPNFKL